VDFRRSTHWGRRHRRPSRGIARRLTADDVLIVHETNLAYSLPRLDKFLAQSRSGDLPRHDDERDGRARPWVLPAHSPLEAWADYEPWTGIHCLMQPTMAPLHDTRHSGDVFLSLARTSGKPLRRTGQQARTFHDWLMMRWRKFARSIVAAGGLRDVLEVMLQKRLCVAQAKQEPAPPCRSSLPPSRRPRNAGGIALVAVAVHPPVRWAYGASRAGCRRVPQTNEHIDVSLNEAKEVRLCLTNNDNKS